MLEQKGTKLRCQTIKWDVGLHPLTCSLHIPHWQQRPGSIPSAHWQSGGLLAQTSSTLRIAIFNLKEAWCCLSFARDLKSWCILRIIWHLIHHHRIPATDLPTFQGMFRGHHWPSLIPPSDLLIVTYVLHAHPCLGLGTCLLLCLECSSAVYSHDLLLHLLHVLPKCYLLSEAFPSHLFKFSHSPILHPPYFYPP